MNKDRRDLTDLEKSECAALKAAVAAYNLHRGRTEKLTQEYIAQELGMTQGNLSSHLNGKRPINKEIASKMAVLLRVKIESFSPRLSAEIAEMAAATGGQPYQYDDKYLKATVEHRQAVDELADKLLGLSPEQALKVKQAMELLMPSDDRTQD